MLELPLTQRAYTLRLAGTNPDDPSWRNALWKTHEAVNRGCKALGEWLLTLRGGLDHTLADEPPVDDVQLRVARQALGREFKGRTREMGKRRKPTDEEVREKAGRDRLGRIRNRRILLALSWLSVEDAEGAPSGGGLRVACGADSSSVRSERLVAALREILRGRGVSEREVDGWVTDVRPSLSAAIRPDAVWVNRSAAFDQARRRVGESLTREEVWDVLGPIFGSREGYLAGKRVGEETESEEREAGEDERAEDLIQKAGQWLSSRFGRGKGADYARIADGCEAIARWTKGSRGFASGREALDSLWRAVRRRREIGPGVNGILSVIAGPGYKSATRNIIEKWEVRRGKVGKEDLARLRELAGRDAEGCQRKIGRKGRKVWADRLLGEVEEACGFTYREALGGARHREFAVMLDQAARRVAAGHAFIKHAEARRRGFRIDSARMAAVPETAGAWLRRYCARRSEESGAASDEGYRIRKRAVQGWEHVTKEWSRPECGSASDRIQAARNVQGGREMEKFGDIRLFEALATDEAAVVWRREDGKVSPSILLDWCAAATAEYNERRFKVPCYRHPDPLRHPVFCDFGASRWDIAFALLEGRRQPAKKRTKDMEAWISDEQGLEMALWDGKSIMPMRLRWLSGRLRKDLALGEPAGGEDSAVARADRLGRGAAGVGGRPVSIDSVFLEGEWNGRLQARREELDRIAGLIEKGQAAKSEKLRGAIGWFISFSPRLRPHGPFIRYAEEHGLEPGRGGIFYPNVGINKGRGSRAKLILSRLPGLRVLSVHLGHRRAAACAVWEVLSGKAFRRELAAGKSEGAEVRMGEMDAVVRYSKKESAGLQKGDKADGKKRRRTGVYRRVGPEVLPGGKWNPGPWARLERQFFINLPGEETEAREASNEEIWQVHCFETELGWSVPLIDRWVRSGWGRSGESQRRRRKELEKMGWVPKEAGDGGDDGEADFEEGWRASRSVDDLMSRAVRMARLALQRHGDRARIAFYLGGAVRLGQAGPGEETTENERVELVAKALDAWRLLAAGRRWEDETARRAWDEYIGPRLGGRDLRPAENESGATIGRQSREDDEIRGRIVEVARGLASDGAVLGRLHELWSDRWREDDGVPARKDVVTGQRLEKATGWYARLRWLHDWLLPRARAASSGGIRHVGGLSLSRITRLRSLYEVQKAFRMRPDPADVRKGVPVKHEEGGRGFGSRILEAVERLREQRVKQLASRIVEAALGLGQERDRLGMKPIRRRVEKSEDARFAPCHAVVIENLMRYRPDETRTRRENRRLMEWSSSKIRKYLRDGCYLYGLHLREVSAAHAAVQDSRTGAAGVRCDEVGVREFVRSSFWRRQISVAAGKKPADRRPREELILELARLWTSGRRDDEDRSARIPVKGGEMFVTLDGRTHEVRSLHAGLNTAANIGLRALMDPDWPGRWWYVPCDAKDWKPVEDEVRGSLAFRGVGHLNGRGEMRNGMGGGAKSGDIVNLWRDVSGGPLAEGDWKRTREYWMGVEAGIVAALRKECVETGRRA